jgi:hypothetical protein
MRGELQSQRSGLTSIGKPGPCSIDIYQLMSPVTTITGPGPYIARGNIGSLLIMWFGHRAPEQNTL